MTSPLTDFIDRAQRLFVLTGAGCSASGIPITGMPTASGRTPPVTYQAFMGEAATRQRYWARSLLGWPRFGLARPNGTHQALAALESRGKLQVLLTQNVDGLHQRAGSRNVIDLHGRLDLVRCMCCERRSDRGSSSSACWTPTPAGTRWRPASPRTATPTWRPISPASWYPGARTAAGC